MTHCFVIGSLDKPQWNNTQTSTEERRRTIIIMQLIFFWNLWSTSGRISGWEVTSTSICFLIHLSTCHSKEWLKCKQIFLSSETSLNASSFRTWPPFRRQLSAFMFTKQFVSTRREDSRLTVLKLTSNR